MIRQIEAILREEMDAIGGQEIRMPVVHPAEIWQPTGRWDRFGPVLQKFTTDGGRDFVLGPTHEEIVALLAPREIDSYKQLPQHVYQIQTKYRNEGAPARGIDPAARVHHEGRLFAACRFRRSGSRSTSGWYRAYRAIFARVACRSSRSRPIRARWAGAPATNL